MKQYTIIIWPMESVEFCAEQRCHVETLKALP